jgi:hypothetical protein
MPYRTEAIALPVLPAVFEPQRFFPINLARFPHEWNYVEKP